MLRPKTTVPTDREGQLIHRIARIIPSARLDGVRPYLRIGIGDDGTVLNASTNRDWVLSCDSSLEGVHFHPHIQPPESVGYKSLARATSDLAAMGARPAYFLLALALPSQKTNVWLDRFARGMARGARKFGMRLIGGDISRADSVMISVTVLGTVAFGRAVLRSGARRGDLIYVSGKLGVAQLGLELIKRGLAGVPEWDELLRPHFYPKIRLKLGQWLAERQVASAMMDLSDGLSMDLPRLCQASGVGAKILKDKIPQAVIPGALSKQRLDPLALALHGGEDYELLFTVPPKFANRLRNAPQGTSLKCIGEITKNQKILLIAGEGTASRLPVLGWDHFRNRSS
ncbi:MAG TPA: thiamine-phosphate kinase [Candidatus Acidoferrales bacterium]|nr:thiamine-phosphate kinase [Candidatus Acidoferrales bacterium]